MFSRTFSTITAATKQSLIFFIKVYRYLLSPLLGPSCRFIPLVQSYAETAVIEHGVGRGIILALKRLCRCHPFNPGGYDPVPTINK